MINKKWCFVCWIPVPNDPQMKRMYVYYSQTKQEAILFRRFCLNCGYEVEKVQKFEQ